MMVAGFAVSGVTCNKQGSNASKSRASPGSGTSSEQHSSTSKMKAKYGKSGGDMPTD
jgi:hypothetical protein